MAAQLTSTAWNRLWDRDPHPGYGGYFSGNRSLACMQMVRRHSRSSDSGSGRPVPFWEYVRSTFRTTTIFECWWSKVSLAWYCSCSYGRASS